MLVNMTNIVMLVDITMHIIKTFCYMSIGLKNYIVHLFIRVL